MPQPNHSSPFQEIFLSILCDFALNITFNLYNPEPTPKKRHVTLGNNLQPLALIDKYYGGNKEASKILLAHSIQVAKLAVSVASHAERTEAVDLEFVETAALLHDIGMLYTDSPKLACFGDKPYICHGIIGAELLREEGLPRHALVCERHIGVGLSVKDIREQELPLPHRDMSPQTLEERIIAYADLFYSKTTPGKRTAEKVRSSLARFDSKKVDIFNRWHQKFQP